MTSKIKNLQSLRSGRERHPRLYAIDRYRGLALPRQAPSLLPRMV